MNKVMIFMLAATVAVLVTASRAGTGTLLTSSQPTLLVVGHVDSVDRKTDTLVVVGQRASFAPATTIPPYLSTGIYGTIGADGKISVSKIETGLVYVAGATPVFLTGVVVASQKSLGRIIVGTVTIDVTKTLAATNGVVPAVGSLVQLSGTQPVEGGILLADEIRVGAERIATSSLLEFMALSHWGLSGSGITGSGVPAPPTPTGAN